ncbi:metallophosphoesterase family protein [Nocardia aurantia]|uniref:3',5'-cyclic adenosine monophosphate phosphodiesterase CpdA n=1 Tax=Nocardia aurantia TaxID=2585199 RepID=A0A7K0DW86_9NOCA|nr:metallophosphoesterase [Nocardia aurantia]MQY30036.1 3',5'-cyclic adenosine monophosphate phosphodiesterase CpdA [Nocardia aurantia]
MSCCGPTRRRLLGALATTAAALPVLTLTGPGPARARGTVIATDLEVVTVTDTTVILTWSTRTVDGTPVAADTEVAVAPADSPATPSLGYSDPEPTPYHYAEIRGLEPGRAYRFEARSGGVRAAPAANLVTARPGTPETLGVVTTLVPPPGRHLRTLALSNDTHIGETVAGLIRQNLPPGVSQEPGLPPYPEVMLDALLDDLRRPDRGVHHLLVAGDLTAEATPDQVATVRSRLDGWGAAGRDWFAVRGNHDRPHTGDDYRACSPNTDAAHHDCWGDRFAPRGSLTEHRVGGLRLLGLDTTELDIAGGSIEPEQLDHLRTLLADEPDRPTVVFGHHPVTSESGATNMSGMDFILDRGDAAALQSLYRAAPGVFLHHSGHSHRNRRTRPDLPIPVDFVEVGAVKEYPGGYAMVRLYEGGYMLNFHKTRTENAKRWSTRSRAEYLGLEPEYTLGTTTDRNYVVTRDLSGLAAA